IVFSGVCKDRHEIRQALTYRSPGCQGILLFNVESEAELDVLIDEAARQVRKGSAPPSVAVRVNPDVHAGGHPHIATGLHEHKFGLDWPAAKRLYLAYRRSNCIPCSGISPPIASHV